ncbi:hypothetical protein D3C76_1639330 [compost metagenome]
MMAAECSAALPTMAMTKAPTNSSDKPNLWEKSSSVPTIHSLTSATMTVARTRNRMEVFLLQAASPCSTASSASSFLWVTMENSSQRKYATTSRMETVRLRVVKCS